MKLLRGWKIFTNKCGGFHIKPKIRKLKINGYLKWSLLLFNIVLTYESWEI